MRHGTMEPKIFTFDLAGRPLKMEIGKYANLCERGRAGPLR